MKYYFEHTTFLYSSTRSSGHDQNFRFSSRKSQSQQKLSKKITHFTIQFRSKTSFYGPQPISRYKTVWYIEETTE